MNALFRNIRIRIFSPGNKRSTRKIFSPPAGKYFTAGGVNAQLGHTAAQIEKNFPGHEYKLVPLGPAEFNFVWIRELEEMAS